MYTYEDVKNIIIGVVREIDEELDPAIEITENTNLLTDLSYDSYHFIRMTVAIEAKLNIQFSVEESDIYEVSTVAELAQLTFKIYKETQEQ